MENVLSFSLEKHCEAILRNAKEMNGVKFAELPVDLLVLDEEYQRPEHSWRQIATNWNDMLVGTIICSYRDCRFYVIDGATRCRAAKFLGKETINAIVYTDLTLEQEADLFARQDENKKLVTQSEKFNAHRVAKLADVLAIDAICKEYHVKPVRGRDIEGVFLTSITAVKEIYAAHGEKGLRWAFDVIQGSNWHDARGGYGSTILYMLKYVYGQFGAAADRALMLILRNTQPYMLVAQAQVATGIPGQKRALITYIERELAK